MKAKVLKTDREYKAALAYIERLMEQSTPDEAELDLWSLLVENYEEAHFPIAKPDPVEAIRFRLEQSDSKPSDLLPYLGTKSRVSEVMSGKRPLSLAMIRALHHGLKIPAEVLIEEPKRPTKSHRHTLHATTAK
ncbi:MAG: transcriptional regulator [Opitutaceae bacterium]|jgi:HTH-type transcriptional regulator/antitoxin HigA